MKKYVITEKELNAVADLLNALNDKDGALLRPTRIIFDAAWMASTSVSKRGVVSWDIVAELASCNPSGLDVTLKRLIRTANERVRP